MTAISEDRLDPDNETSASVGVDRLTDLRAAAVGLRQLAALTDAIGNPGQLVVLSVNGVRATPDGDELHDRLLRIAAAAAAVTTPNPKEPTDG